MRQPFTLAYFFAYGHWSRRWEGRSDISMSVLSSSYISWVIQELPVSHAVLQTRTGSVVTAGIAKMVTYAWFAFYKNSTQPVGLKEPNQFGLYDMFGKTVINTVDAITPDVVNKKK